MPSPAREGERREAAGFGVERRGGRFGKSAAGFGFLNRRPRRGGLLTVYTVYTVYTHMNIDLVLSQSDSRPMYQQILDQVRQQVEVGDLPPGHKLPSIRELAMALQVSVITVKRAYLELEREGVIVTQQGRGSWISEQVEARPARRDELDRQLEAAARIARSMDIDRDALVEMLDRHLEPPNEHQEESS